MNGKMKMERKERGSQKSCVFISCSKSECSKVKRRMKTERKKKMFLRGRKKEIEKDERG